jgi:hypothetical protein
MVVGWYVIDPPETGVLAAFTKRITAAMSGQIPIAGTMFSPQIPKLAAAMIGAIGPAGGVNAVLPNVQASILGAQAQSGNIASLMKQVAAAMVATQAQSGALASTLPKSSALITGSTFNAAILAASVQKLQANLVGAQSQSGAMASTLPKVSAAANDSPSGAMASTIKAVQSSLNGFMVPQGGIASTLPKASAALAGSHAQSGSFASTMKTVQALLAAQQSQIGTMAPTLRKVSASMLTQNPVLFQAKQAESSTINGFINILSLSYTYNATPATGLCGIVVMGSYSSASDHTRAATWGGAAMTEIATVSSGVWCISIFGKLSPATGSQTVAVSVSGTNAGRQLWAAPATYTGVGSFGPNTDVTQNSTQTVSSAVNEMIVNIMLSAAGITSYSQTVRGGPSSAGGSPPLNAVWGDAAGAASVIFSAATPGFTAACRLLPI